MDDAEFEAALSDAVSQGAPELTGTPPEAAEAPEAPEVVEEAPAPEAEPEVQAVEEPEADEPTSRANEPEDSPYPEEVQAYLSKYGGDVAKALEAAIHAQAKIGEQGNEIGELRRMVQEIYERPEPEAPRPQQAPFLNDQVQAAIEENPAQVAAWAFQNEQHHIFEAAMNEWYEQEPRRATQFEMAVQREMTKREVREELAPTQQTVQEQAQARKTQEAHRALQAKYPDFQQVLETATADETAGIDRNLIAQLLQDNPQGALEYTYRWVKSERVQNQATQNAQRVEETREEKRKAAVVTAEETHVTTEPTVQDKLAKFMLDPDPWSVSDSLTS